MMNDVYNELGGWAHQDNAGGEFGPRMVGVANPGVAPQPQVNPYEDARRDAFECTMSLCRAMEEAGGSIINVDLEKMSLLDFITNIASQNNIRFVCIKKSYGSNNVKERS